MKPRIEEEEEEEEEPKLEEAGRSRVSRRLSPYF